VPLLAADPLARDALVVLPKGGQPRVLISGLRLTFPQWSQGHETISVWGTFTPSHQSWVDSAVSRGLTMRPGDPAAVIDVHSGTIRWLAINGDEQAQVGHYLQLKRDFPGALDLYRKAEKSLPKLEPLTPIEIEQGVPGSAARRRMFEFLMWHCLTKLHQDGEAADRLNAFERACQIQWPAATGAGALSGNSPGGPNTPSAASATPLSAPQARPQAEQLASVIRAFAEAQGLLSVSDLDSAIEFFNHKLDARHSKAGVDSLQRLGDVLALSQLELLAGRSGSYLELVTSDLGPPLATALEDRRNASSTDGADIVRLALADCAGRALNPLFHPEFLRHLPADRVAQAAARWRALRPACKSQSAALVVDYVSRGLLPAGRDHDRDELNARIARNPARPWFNWDVNPLP
jgi:hypothetical protein